jgi:hypothetical protein
VASDYVTSNCLIDILSIGMLKMDPKERLSIGECLKEASNVGLFDDHTFARSATPIQQTAQQGEGSDDDGSTTIILGALGV